MCRALGRLASRTSRTVLTFGSLGGSCPPPRSRQPAHLALRLAGCSDTNAAGGGRQAGVPGRHGAAPTSRRSPGSGPRPSGRRSAVSSATDERSGDPTPSRTHGRQQVVGRMPTPPANGPPGRPPDPLPSAVHPCSTDRTALHGPPRRRTGPPHRPTARPMSPPPDAHDPALGHLPDRQSHGARRLAYPPRLRAHRRHRPPGHLDRPPPVTAPATGTAYRHQSPATGTARHGTARHGTAPARPTATGRGHRSPCLSPGHLGRCFCRAAVPDAGRSTTSSPQIQVRLPTFEVRYIAPGLASRPWLHLCGIPDSSVCSGRDAAPRLLTIRSRGLTRRWGTPQGYTTGSQHPEPAGRGHPAGSGQHRSRAGSPPKACRGARSPSTAKAARVPPQPSTAPKAGLRHADDCRR
jgi:hypothetical protein